MKRENLKSLLVFVLLVAVGVGCRRLIDVYNFWPTTAVALFAGYFFRSRLLGIFTAFTALTISNLTEPSYGNYWTAISVYGCLAFSVWLGSHLGKKPTPAKLCLASLGSSTVFFIVTNFACWAGPKMFDHTWEGLVECYTVAIPFFRNTIGGDLFYTAAIFGAYALAVELDFDFFPRRMQLIPIRKR